MKTTQNFWEALQTEHRLARAKTVQDSRIMFFAEGLSVLAPLAIADQDPFDELKAAVEGARRRLEQGGGAKTVAFQITAEHEDDFQSVWARLPNITSKGTMAEVLLSIGVDAVQAKRRASKSGV